MTKVTNDAHTADTHLFDEVLFLGPDMDGQGGIASVLKAYKRELPVFHFLPTNSPAGTLPGLFVVAKTIVKMPFERLRGRRIAHIHFAVKRSWPRKIFLAHWAKLLGFKVVMHCHSGAFKDFSARKGYDSVGRMLNRFDHSVVLSEYWKDFFEHELNSRHTSVVPNIVDCISVAGAPACDAEHPFVFLFLGKIVRNKGVFELIEACRRLHDVATHGWQLLLGGEGEDFEAVREQIELAGLSDRIQLLGWIGGNAKLEAFGSSHALILPSHYEGVPICVLESLAIGRGVIATPVGGVPEIIEDGISGQLVGVKDVDGIARAMQYYIDNPDKAADHGQIGASILNRFTPQAVISSLQKIYSEL